MALILSHAESFGQFHHGTPDLTYLSSRPVIVVLRKELDDGFLRYIHKSHPELFVPELALDAAILYWKNLTNATRITLHNETTYLSTVVEVLLAVWLVRSVRSSQEFQASARFQSKNSFAGIMDFWGMTVERFMDLLENVRHSTYMRRLFHANGSLRQSVELAIRQMLGYRVPFPSNNDLLTILKSPGRKDLLPKREAPLRQHLQHAQPIEQHQNNQSIQPDHRIIAELEGTTVIAEMEGSSIQNRVVPMTVEAVQNRAVSLAVDTVQAPTRVAPISVEAVNAFIRETAARIREHQSKDGGM